MIYRIIGKRLLDLLLVIPAILAVLPIMICLALEIQKRLGAPVLFRQCRAGGHGRIFRIYKFRTMVDREDASGRLLPDSDRLDNFGKWLRSTSLDELPELLNVLKGDMSMVGPRPLLVSYLDRYSSEQARRHDVKPGITGWAQVNGRNAISWKQKFAYDVWYVDHMRLSLDVQILGLTVLKVLKREGISAEGDVTMPEFLGHS